MREEFKIPQPQWPDSRELTETLMKQAGATGRAAQNGVAVSAALARAVAAVATDAWKAQTKMMDPVSKEAKSEYRPVYRHVEGILKSLKEIGVEIQDHTDAPFDYGLPLKVVTTQPTPGLKKERVIETFKPTIYWQGQIIQMGEVVIATPA
jgi:hypothetical protein